MRQECFSRRRFTSALGLAVACLAAPDLRAQTRPEKTRIAIAVCGKASFYALPLTIADQLGFFKAEGLEVVLTDYATGAQAQQSALDGACDVVSDAFDHTISLQSRNHFFQAFVLQGRAPQVVMGVSRKAMPAYRVLGDLRGKRIGVSEMGSTTNMVANMVLARSGIKPADVTMVAVGAGTPAVAALRLGQIDALSHSDPAMTILEQKGDIRVISDTRTMKGTAEIFGGAMPAGCLYASAAFIENFPNTTQALANAIVHSLKWLQTAGPNDIIKTIPEAYFLGDRGLYLASFDKMREAIALDGLIPEDGAKVALKALASFDPMVKADKIDLAKTFTNEFARRAKVRFKA